MTAFASVIAWHMVSDKRPLPEPTGQRLSSSMVVPELRGPFYFPPHCLELSVQNSIIDTALALLGLKMFFTLQILLRSPKTI